jgi:hypothetical protein
VWIAILWILPELLWVKACRFHEHENRRYSKTDDGKFPGAKVFGMIGKKKGKKTNWIF